MLSPPVLLCHLHMPLSLHTEVFEVEMGTHLRVSENFTQLVDFLSPQLEKRFSDACLSGPHLAVLRAYPRL